jgi:osmotically-inducible protein OsmY
MADRNNWERERMREHGGHEADRENWGRGRENWRPEDRDREREFQAGGEEQNRGWGREYRGREEGRGEGRWNEERGYQAESDQRRQGSRGYDVQRVYEGSRGGYQGTRGYEGSRGNEGYQGEDYRGSESNRGEGYRGNEGYGGGQGHGGGAYRGDYGPGAFTRQFRGGTEYFGTGQRGYGTTWGGQGGGSSSYSGGESGYTGGIGTYGEQGRYAGRGPKGYQRSDDRIREDICERLTQHPEIDAVEIDIRVENGEVTLTGTVERRDEKRRAEDVAEGVSGVKDVHNQLRTGQPQGAIAGQGTTGSQANKSETGSGTAVKNK